MCRGTANPQDGHRPRPASAQPPPGRRDRWRRNAEQSRERVDSSCLGDQGEHLTPAATLLEDLRTVFVTAEVVKLSTERVLELLAALRPTIYGAWTPIG